MTSLLCVVKRLHMFDPRTTFVACSHSTSHIGYGTHSDMGMRWQMLNTSIVRNMVSRLSGYQIQGRTVYINML